MKDHPFSDEDKDTVKASLTKNQPKNETEMSEETTSPSHIVVINEQTDNIDPSILRRLGGYMIRNGTIILGTVIGGSIGFGIMTGEYSYAAAALVVKMGSPIIVGSIIGYVGGWGGGRLIQRRITGRW